MGKRAAIPIVIHAAAKTSWVVLCNMPYKRTPRVAYGDQKKSALKRGVGWSWDYETWVAWWKQHLGHDWFAKRGHKTGQYVMARDGDCGPYAPWNVRCALVQDNHNDYNLNKRSQANKPHRKRLKPEIVAAIYASNELYAEIAAKHGLDVHAVHRIKCGKCYNAITNGLEKGRHL